MKNTTNLRYGKVSKDYYGHQGALYKNEKVIIKEVTSSKIKVETLTGKIYWLSAEYITIS
tara:strand:- start:1176 stop:1355 length:180 start_codon:yes stop_codon:yes gene_type:complete